MKMRLAMRFAQLLGIFTLGASFSAFGLTYPLTDSEVVGEVLHIQAKYEDTFAQLGRKYNIGAYALERANPDVDIWMPGAGTPLVIPSAFVLPNDTRNGIVVNLPELRLYYFDPKSGQVSTFPIGAGKEGWSTPSTFATVTEKTANPTWVVPASILAEHEASGDPIPGLMKADWGSYVPPGDLNPLGAYRLRLSIPGYLLHGTNSPIGVGRQVTHGCMRLFPEDIESLFNMVSVGTPVYIVNEPIKLGWRGNELYLEVHKATTELTENQRKVMLVDQIDQALHGKNVDVDWNLIHKIMKQQNGIAQVIGRTY
jgi:L,D-transpeptidase ErfK/SrfK